LCVVMSVQSGCSSCLEDWVVRDFEQEML
jgi:hypothetical protein